jgi:hypothetical protein
MPRNSYTLGRLDGTLCRKRTEEKGATSAEFNAYTSLASVTPHVAESRSNKQTFFGPSSEFLTASPQARSRGRGLHGPMRAVRSPLDVKCVRSKGDLAPLFYDQSLSLRRRL